MQRLSLSLAFSIDIMDYDQDCHLNFIAGLEKKIKHRNSGCLQRTLCVTFARHVVWNYYSEFPHSVAFILTKHGRMKMDKLIQKIILDLKTTILYDNDEFYFSITEIVFRQDIIREVSRMKRLTVVGVRRDIDHSTLSAKN